MNWYNLKPVDTLLFKGAEPMVRGENHTASTIFPPPAQTLTGALRTAILIQNEISIRDYYAGKVDAGIFDIIGPADESAGFRVIGPLFQLGVHTFVPAPYSWFTDKRDITDSPLRVYKGRPISSNIIKTADQGLLWAKGGHGELATMGGRWIALDDLYAGKDSITIKEVDDFFCTEARTGIALGKNRMVRDGHLYAFSHIRLHENVRILFGVDQELPIAESGVFNLGAEKRVCFYEKMLDIQFREDQGEYYFTLSVVEGSEAANDAVVATGKIQYLGGWDMKKGFHKPMKGYYPAGSVFNKKFNNNFIPV